MITLIKKDNGYLIMSDTTINLGDYNEISNKSDNVPIYEDCDKTNTLIGNGKSFRENTLIKHTENLLPSKDEPLTMKYMVNEFVFKAYNAMCDMGYKDSNKFPHFESSFIVCRGEDAYIVQPDGSVMKAGTEDSVGEASFIADSILNVLPEDKDAYYKLGLIYLTAYKNSQIFGGDLILADTRNGLKFKTITTKDLEDMVNGTYIED